MLYIPRTGTPFPAGTAGELTLSRRSQADLLVSHYEATGGLLPPGQIHVLLHVYLECQLTSTSSVNFAVPLCVLSLASGKALRTMIVEDDRR
jgi:hypothetical protein